MRKEAIATPTHAKASTRSPSGPFASFRKQWAMSGRIAHLVVAFAQSHTQFVLQFPQFS